MAIMTDRRTASSSLSVRLLAFLRDRGYTQAEVARMLGLSEGFISLVKCRERSFSLEHLQALAEALNVPLGALLLEVSQPQRTTPETAALMEVIEALIRKTDVARAALREHIAAVAKRG
jgi:transcriptional regulator with XRE-family HTH domain